MVVPLLPATVYAGMHAHRGTAIRAMAPSQTPAPGFAWQAPPRAEERGGGELSLCGS